MRATTQVVVALALALSAPVISKQEAGAAPMPKVQASGPEVYADLRDKALKTTPHDLGLSMPAAPMTAYGVVMDLDLSGRTVTVVALSTGDASIYFSTGGGMIGGRGHPEVENAAKRFVAEAQLQLGGLTPQTTHPRPGPGEVYFYILTTKGVVRVSGVEDALDKGSGRLSGLFADGQTVITRLRQTQPGQS